MQNPFDLQQEEKPQENFSTCSTINSLTQDIKRFIDLVRSGKFDIQATAGDYIVAKVDKKNDDGTRPLKSVATDIVVNEFFKTDSSLYQFLAITSRSFERMLSLYAQREGISGKDLFFVYKGGNILRIISKEFLLELPNSATRELDEYYRAFFKRGDADFGIYINPYLEDYEKVFHDVTMLSYLLQAKLRMMFSENMMKYFDFFRFNKEYQQILLRPYLDQFNQAKGFENQFIDFRIGDASSKGMTFNYVTEPDQAIDFINKNEDWMTQVRDAAILNIFDSKTEMKITHNNALDFAGEKKGVRMKFNLTRTKFFFTLLKVDGTTRNVGGELIDVGVSHRSTSSTDHFFENVNQYITTYRLSYKNVCDLKFMAYSMKYLIHDLEDILFDQKPYPWTVMKYEKRLNRYIYMHFINIFIQMENGTEKRDILQDLLRKIFIPLSKLTRSSMEEFFRGLKYFKDKWSDRDLEVHSFVRKLENLSLALRPDDFEAMREMSMIMVKNGEFLIKSLDNVRNYCSVEGRVSKKSISYGSFGSLV